MPQLYSVVLASLDEILFLHFEESVSMEFFDPKAEVKPESVRVKYKAFWIIVSRS